MTSSGTFSICYEFSAETVSDAEQAASDIALEQTVELPFGAVASEFLQYTGSPSGCTRESDDRWSCTINYATEVAGNDILQFLNVMFGNVSIKPGVKVTDFNPGALSSLFPGPQFGIDGIRELTGANGRPLSCTALKPLGASPDQLAEIAYSCASGGIDIIKDDHGLANQSMARFEERVSACVSAIRKSNRENGSNTLYFPNVTTRIEDLIPRAKLAQSMGADGLLVSPQLTGLSALISLAECGAYLPIMAHPAFSGPYTINTKSGIEADIYFGKLWRAFGADAVIYPNAGGRFSYTIDECLSINDACRDEFGTFRPIFPVPGGGIDRDSVSKWKEKYGQNTIFLIGGSLYMHPDGIKTAVQEFQKSIVEG